MEEKDCEGWRTPLRCDKKVTDGGVNSSGFCEDCHRSIDDIRKYRELRREGYSQTQAALMSGLSDPSE